MDYELSIILPTYNEADNIIPLLNSLNKTLLNISWEAIVVDDSSPDKTAEVVNDYIKDKPNIRCLKRIGKRGLSSAIIEGISLSNSDCIAVMDTDLQHDESLLNDMFYEIKENQLDIVIGSRYINDNKFGGLSNNRLKISKYGTYIAQKTIHYDIKDPLSGYFMLRRDTFNGVKNSLTGIGYKILIDILYNCKKELKYKELPFNFRNRKSGKSKLNLIIIFQYMYMLLINIIKKLIAASSN